MFNYERDYGQENGETRTESNREDPSVIPRINFASEKSWEFVIEALFFAIIVAISAWPMVTAAGAINKML